ncbi:MAG TPA: efflux RND transporter periplasmic adaptor subunit [Bacteroidota bacterium]|nr:efflux RND transporter periplasmic adaptor subunit [Bacteroidota bacterium]
MKIDTIQERNAVVTISAVGKTDALRKEKFYSPISGKIISMKAFVGNTLHRRDTVAVIQSKESYAAINGAEAMARSAATSEKKAEAERLLKTARSTQSVVSVLSKFDGVVSSRTASEGELVPENGELMTMVDLSTVDFLADIPVGDVPLLAIGERADVEFPSLPGKIYPAVVEAINPQADEQSQTVFARLKFQQPHSAQLPILRTDIMGTAIIYLGVRPHALFVPRSAVLRDDENNTYSIVIVTQDSLAKSVSVSVKSRTDSSVEITGPGLRAGLPVITEGNYSLADSTRVTVAQRD